VIADFRAVRECRRQGCWCMAVGECRFAKEHEGQYDWVRKNEGHKGVQVTPLSGFGDLVVQALGTCRTGNASVRV